MRDYGTYLERAGRRITDTFINSLTAHERGGKYGYRGGSFVLAVRAGYWVGKAVALRPNEPTVLQRCHAG